MNEDEVFRSYLDAAPAGFPEWLREQVRAGVEAEVDRRITAAKTLCRQALRNGGEVPNDLEEVETLLLRCGAPPEQLEPLRQAQREGIVLAVLAEEAPAGSEFLRGVRRLVGGSMAHREARRISREFGFPADLALACAAAVTGGWLNLIPLLRAHNL